MDYGAGQQDPAEVGQGVFVVASGNTAPLLEPVATPLDGVAQRVARGVECGRASTVGPFGFTPGDLVTALGNGVFDSAGT